MKEYTISYDTKEKGISGEFKRTLPEMTDFGLDPENAQHQSLYWGWFRQVLVTLRAQAKRFREGNKTVAARSASDTAAEMGKVKLPQYKEPTEGLTAEERAEKALEALSPEQIKRLLEKAGISYQ